MDCSKLNKLHVPLSKEIASSFFLSGFIVELEKFMCVQRPTTIQQIVRLSRFQDEVLQEIARKPLKKKSPENSMGTN